MDVRPLAIAGAYEFTPRQFPDDRGLFLEWFKTDVFSQHVGHPLAVAQANQSVSRRGTMRGVHFADVPPGQAKYVYCPRGAVLDVAIDIRVGSPTYGEHDKVVLDERDRRAIYLAEGIGHVFMALEDDSAVTYLVSTPYNPGAEHGITPLDPDLGIDWPSDVEPLLSPKDTAAPTLEEARKQGLLPTWDACQARYDDLRRQ